MNKQELTIPQTWEILAGGEDDHTRLMCPVDGTKALEALLELNAKPALLVLDDLSGQNRDAWKDRLNDLKVFFDVESPVLPVHKSHGRGLSKRETGGRGSANADDLLSILRFELQRLRRPLAAVVDMQWVFCDSDRNTDRGRDFKARWFGLELIRLLKRAKPSLPLFVWSPIKDRQILQRAMQLGAASCFDKDPDLNYEHDLTGTPHDHENLLTPGALWFRILEWEMTRYLCPPVGSGQGTFIIATTPSAAEGRRRFLDAFKLTENDLLKQAEPEVEQLLRALLPGAVEVEILRFFGEGQSRAERPFVVRGRTAGGRWLRPVQVKLSKDWRTLAREGKGYRDVFAGRLGPTVAHLLNGPFRKGRWCGMSQSFAAPEEAIRDIVSKSTRSLNDWLRKYLTDPAKCRLLVDEIFEGVLDPLYKDNLSKTPYSVFRAFDRVSPAHIEAGFVLAEGRPKDPNFAPSSLSLQSDKARREEAGRRWKKVEKKLADGESVTIKGLEIESLEIDAENPLDSRLRLLDSTLGVKVDLKAGQPDVARRWRALAESPIKLVGLPAAFRLDPDKIKTGKTESSNGDTVHHPLLCGWTTSVEKLLRANGILESRAKEDSHKPNQTAWDRCSHYFHPWHPIDWTEDFHIGPTHGDLNLGNILLHEKGDRLFPWLIDFDKAEDGRPVVFDLAKLEIEAYHKIGQELFWELRQLGCVADDSESRELAHKFEAALCQRGVTTVRHLWAKFSQEPTAVPESLQLRFDGFFTYLKQVHKRVEDLKIGEREFLVGRAVYAMCCLKFKHLYQSGKHPNAPFPAKTMLWKLETLIDELDAENGILAQPDGLPDTASIQQQAVFAVVKAVRDARNARKKDPLWTILGTVLAAEPFPKLRKLPDYAQDDAQTSLLRLLRDKQLPGRNRWMRELLWYIRDYGLSEKPDELADFIKGMVKASQPTGQDFPQASTTPTSQFFRDFASTGRLGNTYPSVCMFRHLADPSSAPLIKISSRGESGGTIDVLEQAGIPICLSESEVQSALDHFGWAVAEASSHLCEVDKILMAIRKECGCMKVDDLALTSISAKKAALGIRDFEVQIVTGYDAKFHSFLEASDIKAVGERWNDVWKLVFPNGQVVATPFDSGKIESWKNESGDWPVVFGKTLLAGKIWQMLNESQCVTLEKRLPVKFAERMKEIVGRIGQIQMAVATPPSKLLMDLENIQHPEQMKKLICWEFTGLREEADFESLAVLILKFDAEMTPPTPRIPFWDGLFSEITKSGHPMTGILFGKDWLAVLAPRSDVPHDLKILCWRILRDGFTKD